MKKILITTLLASILGACGSTQPEFTAEKDVNFKPNLEEHSIAYNIAMSAGAPDILKDAEVPEDAYNEVSNASHSASVLAGFMAGGFGSALSFGLDSLAMNKANGFDQPLLTMWVEVNSLEDYGSDDFVQMIYDKARGHFDDAYIGDDVITKTFGSKDSRFYGVYFSGQNCDKHKKRNDIYNNEGNCILSQKVKIIRPVPVGSWLPNMLSLNKEKSYVIVNFEGVSHIAYNAQDKFTNALLFEPASWVLRFNKEGEWVGKRKGMGMPVYKYKDKVYTFIKPAK